MGYPLQYSWASLVIQLVKNLSAMWEIWVGSWAGKIPRRRERLPTSVFWPGEFHGLYSPWGPKESDTTKWLSLFLNGNHNSPISENQDNWCYKHCKDDTSSCTDRLSALPHPVGRPLSVLKGCGPDSTWPPDPLDFVFPHTASPSACVTMIFP